MSQAKSTLQKMLRIYQARLIFDTSDTACPASVPTYRSEPPIAEQNDSSCQ